MAIRSPSPAPIQVGDEVRCERAEPAAGTWPRYAGRVGRVALIHTERFSSGRVYVEVGVCWDMNPDRHGQADSWFLPSELVVVGHKGSRAPGSGQQSLDGSAVPATGNGALAVAWRAAARGSA
jgi:hypothetical protein